MEREAPSPPKFPLCVQVAEAPVPPALARAARCFPPSSGAPRGRPQRDPPGDTCAHQRGLAALWETGAHLGRFPPPPTLPPAVPEAVSGVPEQMSSLSPIRGHRPPSRTPFLPSSNSVPNAALGAPGKLAHRGERVAGVMGWAQTHRGHSQSPRHTLPTRNRFRAARPWMAGSPPSTAPRRRRYTSRLREARQTGGRRPLAPSPRAPALYLGTGLGGSPGRSTGRSAPGGWCGEDRGRRSPLQLRACRAAIYPGARPRPLPEYWAIGPATRCPASRRPLPPPSPAAAAGATWREGAGPSCGLHLLVVVLLLGKLFPVFPPAPSLFVAGHPGQSEPVVTE